MVPVRHVPSKWWREFHILHLEPISARDNINVYSRKSTLKWERLAMLDLRRVRHLSDAAHGLRDKLNTHDLVACSRAAGGLFWLLIPITGSCTTFSQSMKSGPTPVITAIVFLKQTVDFPYKLSADRICYIGHHYGVAWRVTDTHHLWQKLHCGRRKQ